MKETVVSIPTKSTLVQYPSINGYIDTYAIVERDNQIYFRLIQNNGMVTYWEMPIDIRDLEDAVKKIMAIKNV